MDPSDRLLLRTEDRPEVSLHWDRDRPVSARRGDTVSLALLDHGVLETSRSAKYRRPRGAYCLRGDCGTCLVRIDGLPNRRACLTVAREGMQVHSQNRLASKLDPTALIDAMMRGNLDHHHFMVKPRLVNQTMQRVARNLTGLGTLPDDVPARPAVHQRHRPDVLLVGAGAAGAAAHEVLTEAGREVLWVDRVDRQGLETLRGHALPSTLLDHTGVFGVYPAERIWAAMSQPPGQPEVLRSIVPRHVIVATGARDPIIALPDNDRPGVVSARGLLRQLRRSQARLQVPAVVVGPGAHARRLAEALGVEVFEPDEVVGIEGSPVEALRVRRGLRACRLVALAAWPAPAYDLARHAGAALRWDGAGFAVERDALGLCATEPWTVWAAGDVAGYLGDAAADDGRRVAEALLRADDRSAPRESP
ncbi:MAG: (2Fe-2S)-binding protein [Myxococcales bacterium]|nr:(2Fe-2S)-binding protein [Myxococcales bacterium]